MGVFIVIQEVDFYKDFIPNEILEQYIEINKIEDKNRFSIELYYTIDYLKKLLKTNKKEHFSQRFSLQYNIILYYLDSLVYKNHKNQELEKTFPAIKRYLNLEKECINLISHLLNVVSKEIEPLEHKNYISKLFLYSCSIFYISSRVNSIYCQKLKIHNSLCHEITMYVKPNCSIHTNLSNAEKIREHIKRLAK